MYFGSKIPLLPELYLSQLVAREVDVCLQCDGQCHEYWYQTFAFVGRRGFVPRKDISADLDLMEILAC